MCRKLSNADVSDGSQPPMTFDSSVSESAGSRSLDRFCWARTSTPAACVRYLHKSRGQTRPIAAHGALAEGALSHTLTLRHKSLGCADSPKIAKGERLT